MKSINSKTLRNVAIISLLLKHSFISESEADEVDALLDIRVSTPVLATGYKSVSPILLAARAGLGNTEVETALPTVGSIVLDMIEANERFGEPRFTLTHDDTEFAGGNDGLIKVSRNVPYRVTSAMTELTRYPIYGYVLNIKMSSNATQTYLAPTIELNGKYPVTSLDADVSVPAVGTYSVSLKSNRGGGKTEAKVFVLPTARTFIYSPTAELGYANIPENSTVKREVYAPAVIVHQTAAAVDGFFEFTAELSSTNINPQYTVSAYPVLVCSDAIRVLLGIARA